MLKHYPSLKYNPVTVGLTKLVLDLKNRSLESVIFVATTGRSGSETLHKVFSSIGQCASTHEPYPIMNNDLMILRNEGDDTLAQNTYNAIKSVNIRRAALGKKYYIETNHMFIKSFIDYAAKDFPDKLKVIHLYRNPVDVALSILSLNNYPNCYPGTETGNNWYLDYHAAENLIKITDILDNNADFSHTFYKCLWYWFEIEARVKFWKEKLPHIPFYDFNIANLKKEDKFISLLNQLNLEFDVQKIKNTLNTKSNRKTLHKTNSLDRDSAIMMKEQFEKILVDNGYTLPHTLTDFT